MNSKSLNDKVSLLWDADYLVLFGMIELLSASIASFFRSSEFKEIKQEGLELDMTPDEEEELLKAYPWIKTTTCGKYAEISEDLKNIEKQKRDST